MTEQNYVLGFLFDHNRENVLLIEKQRPAKQKGKHNGIGGKVELAEGYHTAMAREFQEETGLIVDDWQHKIILEGPGFKIYVYAAFTDLTHMWQARNVTDEKVLLTKVDNLPTNILSNVPWLIHMCLDNEFPPFNSIKYL